MEEQLIILKLGGSLITDKSKAFTAREKVIARLGREIKSALRVIAEEKTSTKIVIGHGSGSFGHTMAAKYRTQEGIINSKSIPGFPLVSDVAIEINRIVTKNFLKVGLRAVSFSPMSFILTSGQKVKNCFLFPIIQALNLGFIPVIYGDVIFDQKQGFCIFSGEKTLNLLAKNLRNKFKKIRIIYLGETDGVYDKKGKTITKITLKSFNKFEKMIGGSHSTDVTGGMLHKVNESLEMASRYNIDSIIISGLVHGNLKEVLLGKLISGTTITNG
jgi:isopentenyl phosphate kinase